MCSGMSLLAQKEKGGLMGREQSPGMKERNEENKNAFFDKVMILCVTIC